MKKILLVSIIISGLTFSYSQSNSKTLLLENKTKELSQKNTVGVTQQQNIVFHKKNTGLAIIYSLLLPGMGELYAGSYSSGKFFTIADVALWGTYIGMNAYGNMRKRDYQAYAASNGGVNNAGKDDNYYATIGNYLNIDDYNHEKALERNYGELYNKNIYYWNWKTTEQRRTYRDMWVSSESAFNNLRFVAGALILNRIISAINAVRLVAAYNDRNNDNLSWNISVGMDQKPTLPTSLTFNLQTNF